MKTKIKKVFYLWAVAGAALAAVLYSCTRDDAWVEPTTPTALPPLVRQARTFFENYIAAVPPDANTAGIYAGTITPDWKAATLTQTDVAVTLDIPIAAENAYIGLFAKDFTQTPTDAKDYYATAVAQKLVMARSLRDSAWSSLLITIVPAESLAAADRIAVQQMFVYGTSNSAFSGMLLYATVENNQTICVDRYYNGEIYLRRSALDTTQDAAANYEEMKAAAGKTKMPKPNQGKRKSLMRGINDENEIGEVVVTGNGTKYPGIQIFLPTLSIDLNGGGMGESNGRGGVSSGSEGGGGGGGKISSSQEDPFFNTNLTAEQQKILENMLDKIMLDCMGSVLYSELSSSGSINLVYNPNALSNLYNPSSNTITLKNLQQIGGLFPHSEDASLFHEMFHAYQHRAGNLTGSNRGNREAEDKIAQAFYMDRASNPAQWSVNMSRIQENGFMIEAMTLTNYLNAKGQLLPTTTGTSFDADFYDIATEMYKEDASYTIDPTLSFADNLKNLQNLAKDC
ncbi:hypothetical protein FACS1894156_6840 [Bacteroidia bacterium]|nr:hypothetical protein FACS1894156_6840 [Bacteroidia bacterium]